MIRLITYTDHRMTISAERLKLSALKMGVDQVRIYRPEDLSDDFKTKMASVLACERGAGYYCWKPYVVNDAIQDMTDQDVLIWSDAGTEWVQPISNLTNLLVGLKDSIFFSNGWRHVEWCKMDLIKRVWPEYGTPGPRGERMTEHIDAQKQLQASHFLITPRIRMKRLIAEWLELSTEPGLIDNEPSVLPNIPTFREHRWDQSVLASLQILYGFPLHWFPSTYGFHIKDQHPGDHYPAMFLHHRKRNEEW